MSENVDEKFYGSYFFIHTVCVFVNCGIGKIVG